MNPKNHPFFVFVFFLLVCYGVAALGGFWTSLSVSNWYATLQKPSWNPPNWVFAPVWAFLYIVMAVAAWLVWRLGEGEKKNLALSLFAAQLLLNLAWPGLFFGLHNPFVALIDLIALWIFILAAMISFAKISRGAAFLFFFYFAWVSYALSLNAAIVFLNG